MNTRNQIAQWPTFHTFLDFNNTWSPISEIFDALIPLTPALRANRHFLQYEVDEEDTRYLLHFDIPGVKKEDIKIELTHNQIEISGERKNPGLSNASGNYSAERVNGTFQRILKLPREVDAEKVEASYQDGVLKILIPKAEAAKPRQIRITSGTSASKLFSRLLGSKDKEETPSSENSQSAIAS